MKNNKETTDMLSIRHKTKLALCNLEKAYNNLDQEEILVINNDFQHELLEILEDTELSKRDYMFLIVCSLRVHDRAIELLKCL